MRSRNLFLILLLCMTVGVLSACTGDDGATGPKGDKGDPGEVTEVDVDQIVEDVIEELDERDMGPNPDNCTIFADRSRALVGSNRDDVMCGNERNNTIRGAEGDDTIFGREGNDNLQGQGDDDIIYGGPGDDELNGGEDSDELYGEAGNDKLIAGADDDILDGGEGVDMVVYQGVAAEQNMFLSVSLTEDYTEKKRRLGADGNAVTDGSNDTLLPSMAERAAEGEILEDLIDIENIWGSPQPDVLVGNANNNVIGGDGGADYIDGGAGVDTASYLMSDAAVMVSLVAGATNTGGHAAGDVLVNIENLTGRDVDSGEGTAEDSLTGNANDNVLRGMKGEDTLVGGPGNDTLYGGPGNDSLTGGTGKDVFVYVKGDGADTIVANDFSPGTGRGEQGDTIRIEGYTSEELGGPGRDNVEIDNAGVISISGTTIITTNSTSTHPTDITYVVKQ